MKSLLLLLSCFISLFGQSQTLINDPSFGLGKGYVTNNVSDSAAQEYAWSGALGVDGGIFATGQYTRAVTEDQDGFVVKYTSAGILDDTFGVGGILKLYQTDANGGSGAIKIQADGKILIGTNGDNGLSLRRFNSDGSPDSSFNLTGTLHLSNNAFEFAWSIEVIESNKIIVAANLKVNGVDRFALIRINSEGSIDQTFGQQGYCSINFTGVSEVPNRMVIQTNGKIVVAGNCDAPGGMNKCMIARYTSNGTVDSSFAGAGFVVQDVGAIGKGDFRAVTIQQDGKILAAGYTWETTDIKNLLVRFLDNGSLDQSFGNGGIKTWKISGGTNFLTSVKIQQDGKIIAGGSSGAGSPDFRSYLSIYRISEDGSLDLTLDGVGYIRRNVGIESNTVYELLIQPDGKIVTVGTTDASNDNRNVLVMRFMEDPDNISEREPLSNITYPNPTTGLVYFKNLPVGTTTEVFDSNGRLLEKLDNVDKADLRSFAPGIYLFRFTNDKTVYTSKVMLSY